MRELNEPWMYIVLLGLTCLILAYMLPKRGGSSAKSASPSMKEIEETMEGFLAEIEEDNGQLLQTLERLKQDHELAIRRQTARSEELEKRIWEQDQEIKRLAAAVQAAAVLQKAAAPASVETRREEAAELLPVEPSSAAPTMTERFPELFELYDGGKSVEYIAKKLGMNKGEVSLILQLAKQEGREGVEQ